MIHEHVTALQSLMLAHICATHVLVDGSATATLDIVETQRFCAESSGRDVVALRLEAMMATVRDACGMPAAHE